MTFLDDFKSGFGSALGNSIPSVLTAIGSYFINKPKAQAEANASQLARDQFEWEKQKFGELSAYQKAQLEAAGGGGGGGAGTAAQLAIAKAQMIQQALQNQAVAAQTGHGKEADSLIAIARILQSAMRGGA